MGVFPEKHEFYGKNGLTWNLLGMIWIVFSTTGSMFGNNVSYLISLGNNKND